MGNDVLLAAWRREERKPFSGWDFSRLQGRMLQDREPWSYETRAAALLDRSSAVLDMDTGGGELLLRLRTHWPALVVATEGYLPNVLIARKRLAPRGVPVVEASAEGGSGLPFDGDIFDLVLNRHGAFDPQEVARVLAPGGVFLTQQVGGDDLRDLVAVLGGRPQEPRTSAERDASRLASAGLVPINVQSWTGTATFIDISALVYFLHAIPWVVPDFSVDTHAQQLLGLQRRIERGQRLVFAISRYLIEARYPPAR